MSKLTAEQAIGKLREAEVSVTNTFSVDKVVAQGPGGKSVAGDTPARPRPGASGWREAKTV